jgi:inactive STAND
VPLNSCRLSDLGVRARDELLKLVYPDGWNLTILSHDTGLEYGKTIPKILGNKAGGTQLKTLKLFFRKLLGQLQNRYNDNDVRKYIGEYKFTRFCQDIYKDESELILPRDLYQNVIKQVVLKDPICVQPLGISQRTSNFNIELLESLWHLDYEAQENIFRTALKGQSKNLAFTFAAPCPVTQSWILNRLLLRIARKDNRRIFTIDLESSKVRNNYDLFLIHLSELLNTIPDCDRILDRIYEIDSEMSVIIVIKNFRKRQEIQENIMTKFWSNLCSKASEENRLGRVIMFWIDECLLDYQCSIVKLEELKEIHQIGVEQWINEYSGLYPFLSNISTGDFMSNPCDWKDPFLILDGICNQLKIDKGIVNIQSLWENQI